jgi:hypothetical protein
VSGSRVPGKVTPEELEAAFPWVRHLPPEALRQFLAIIDNYRAAAAIYARREPAA